MKETEAMWAGKFGDEYQARSPGNVEANVELFKKVFHFEPTSLIEFGAGSGNNLRAISQLYPKCELAAVELNTEALKAQPDDIEQFKMSMLDYVPLKQFEVAMTKGLLIHIHPDDLPKAYKVLYESSSKWILMCEYFSPQRRMIPYRGENDKLWAADFAAEIMALYPDLELIQYGFTYHLDGQDDITFFLLSKQVKQDYGI